MFNPLFICPCCGVRPVYSIELAQEILKIVSEYYGTDPESVIKNRSPHGIEGRVRSITVYFLRRTTGEWLKRIGEIFSQNPTHTGGQIRRIEEQISSNNEAITKQVNEIRIRIALSTEVYRLIN